MSIRYSRIPIRPCCGYMEEIVMTNDIWGCISFDPDRPKGDKDRFVIVSTEGPSIPLRFCPSCGKRIEENRE